MAYFVTSLIPIHFLFQPTQDEKAEMAANCDHFQSPTTPPKSVMHPISTNMSHVARFADVLPVAAIVSRLSAKSLRRMVQLAGPFTQFVATLSRQSIWSHEVGGTGVLCCCYAGYSAVFHWNKWDASDNQIT